MENKEIDNPPQPVNQGEYVPQPPKTGGLMSYIPTVIVSVITCAAILFIGIIPQPYAKMEDVNKVAAIATDAQTKAVNAQDVVNSVKSAGYVTQAALNGYALQSGLQTVIAPIQVDIATLKAGAAGAVNYSTQITNLQAKIDTLTTMVNAQNVTIQALQSGISVSGGTVASGTVKAAFTTSNWVPTSYTPTATAPGFQLPFKLTITNGLNKQISNLQLYVSMYASTNIPGATGVSLNPISGGAWSMYTAAGNIYYFTNTAMSSWGGTNLVIPANSSQTITLIFNYTAPAAAYGTQISFSPDIATISANDYTVG
jgi:hypothetical protein